MPLDRRPLRKLGVALALMVMASGCAMQFDAASLGVPATLAAPAGQVAEGESFRVTSRAVFGLFGLLSLKRPSLERALAGQLTGGKGVAGVRISVRSTWSDVLVSVLSLGLIVPRAVTFEGVVTDGAPPAAPTTP